MEQINNEKKQEKRSLCKDNLPKACSRLQFQTKIFRNEIWPLAIICDPEILGLMFCLFQITNLAKYFLS